MNELICLLVFATVRYEVYVTHWNSGIMKSVPFSPNLPLSRFMISCGFLFQLPSISKRLYYLHPKAKWEEKVKIINSEQLKDILDHPQEESEHYFYTIYLFTGENSPDSCPKKLLAEDVESPQAKGETESESTSSNSKKRRGSYQSRFRNEILQRDEDICRACSEKDCGEAAHIIDVEHSFTEEYLMRNYEIMSVYDPRNGIILCKNCHSDYDRFILGINPDGNIISTHNESMRTFKSTMFLDNKEKREKKSLLPSKKVLKFKYDRFLESQEEEVISATNSKDSKKNKLIVNMFSFLSLTPKKKI